MGRFRRAPKGVPVKAALTAAPSRAPAPKASAKGKPETARQNPAPESAHRFLGIPSLPPAGGMGNGVPLDEATGREMGRRLGGDFRRVRLHTDGKAQARAETLGARAFAEGGDIAFGPAEYAPHTSRGKRLLAHELAHVAQQQAPVPFVPEDRAEADADAMAEAALAGRARMPAGKARAAVQRKPKPFDQTDQVVSMRVRKYPEGSKPQGEVEIRTLNGKVYRYDASQVSVEAGPHQGTFGKKGLQIDDPASGFVVYFEANEGSPAPRTLRFAPSFPILVEESPLPKAGRGGKGEGGEGGGRKGGSGKTGGDPAEGRKSGPGKDDAENRRGGSREGSQTGDKKGVPGGTGKKGDQGSAEADAAPPPPQDFKGPVISVTDAKQIEALKRKGLLPARTADDIKAKLDKQVNLTFEEAVALIDALSAVSDPPSREERAGRESWLKWAQFVKDHKDQISGRVKSGEKGLSVAEVKAILDKYKEFVGVKDGPGAGTAAKDFDPAKRKSWNSLAPWEKQLWTEYVKRHRLTRLTDEETSDLRLTPSTKLSMALRICPDYVPEGAREGIRQMVNDPLFIGGTLAGITLYVAAWVAPEPIFTKATAAAITTALLALFTVSEIRNFAWAWLRLQEETKAATTIEELENAARHFGEALGGILGRVFITIFTLLIGKALPKPPAAPPAGASGGPSGGGAVATAVGPNGLRVAYVIPKDVPAGAVKVLADGTVIIVTNAGLILSSAYGKGKGSPGSAFDVKPKGPPGGGKTSPEAEPGPKKDPGLEDVKGPKDTSESVSDLENTANPKGSGNPRESATVGSGIEPLEVAEWTPKLKGQGFGEVVPRAKFGRVKWLKNAFPDGRVRPDVVGVDHAGKRILVGDVAAKFETGHFEATLDYAKQLLRNLPAELKGYRVFAQERFWRTGKATKMIEVR
jgi:hypothetical protein